jgi:response regulator of citrate/malate metabolism
MCSAYDTEDNLSLAVEYGMKDFIIKPVRIE